MTLAIDIRFHRPRSPSMAADETSASKPPAMPEQQQQQQQEQPAQQASAESTTLSAPSSRAGTSDYDDSSETVGDDDPYRRRDGPQGRRSIENVLEEDEATELRRIATALSQHRSRPGAPEPTADSEDAALNPESADFDVTKWVRNFISQLNDQGHTSSKLGVLWQDLDVYGSGSALQLQENVTSVLAAPLRAGELFRKKQPKHILHSFNGVLRSGELLVVLGRPGSGCSTFLKAICGELHGLTLGKSSRIHYNGATMAEMSREFKGEVIYNQEVRLFVDP